MLRAFIDDSRMGQPPVYVLGGILNAAGAWVRFVEDWDAILRMSPRIEYFKLAEALGFSGQFHGISKARRDEKLSLLVQAIEDHRLVSVASIMPHDVYRRWFDTPLWGVTQRPYHWCFLSIMNAIVRYSDITGLREKVSFVFDRQRIEEARVIAYWSEFANAAPPTLRELLGDPPTFADDRETIALQAADLVAGWARIVSETAITGAENPTFPWGTRGGTLPLYFSAWTHQEAEELFRKFFSVRTNDVTCRYGSARLTSTSSDPPA
jgi:hypothetical protein